MVHAAHASRYHWSKAGTTVNLGRGEWQIARVYSVLGRAEPAFWHARRRLAYVEAAIAAGEAEDRDLPAAREGWPWRSPWPATRPRRSAGATWPARPSPRSRIPPIARLIEGDLATLPL